MGNEGLSCFATGLSHRGKLLSCDIPALELGCVGGINIVPEFIYQSAEAIAWAYLEVVLGFPFSQEEQGQEL
jgi:hypothetical protein